MIGLGSLADAGALSERVSALEATVRILEAHMDGIETKLWAIMFFVIAQLVAYIVSLTKKGDHHG
jgi:hypothetical protein